MKRLTWYILGVTSVVTASVFAAKNTDNSFKLGDGANTAKIIQLDVGDGATNPELQGVSGGMTINNVPLTGITMEASDIDLGTASDTSRITVGKADTATLTGLTRKVGTIHYDTDQSNIVFDDGTDLRPVGSGTGGGSGINLVPNADFEVNVNDWTASAGVITKEETTVAQGDGSLKWVPTNTAQTLTHTAVAIPSVLSGKNCYAEFVYTTNVGADGDYSFVIKDGVTELTTAVSLPLSTDLTVWRKASAAFLCGAATSPVIEISTTVASPNPIYVDNFHVGSDFRIGVTASFEGWEQYVAIDSATSSAGVPAVDGLAGGWTLSRGVFTPYQTSDGAWRLNFNVEGTGFSSTTGDFVLHGVTFKTGYFQGCSSVGGYTAGGSFSQTSPGSGTVVVRAATAMNLARVSCDVELDSKPTWANETEALPKTVTLETQGWYIDANIGGGAINMGTTDNDSTYTVRADANISLTTTSGSATAYIGCDAEIASGSTCTNDQQPAVAFYAPAAGSYEVCMTFGNYLYVNNNNRVTTTFKLARTENDSDVIITEGGALRGMDFDNRSGFTESRGTNISICFTDTLTTGLSTFKLFEQTNVVGGSNITGAISTNQVLTANDDRLHITVKSLTQNFPQAIAMADATATSAGFIPTYEKVTADLSTHLGANDFTGGSIVAVKIGSTVTITLINPLWAGTISEVGTDGVSNVIIPESMRPSSVVIQGGEPRSGSMGFLSAESSGRVRLVIKLSTNVATASPENAADMGTARSFTLTYNVE